MNSALPLVVANLKANKSWDQVSSWIDDVAQTAQNFEGTIIFCPSFPFLASSFEKISQNGINIKLGAQDISVFEQGAHTGEVSASQIADLVDYSIIGHSERRQSFDKQNEILSKKVQNAKESGIEPIFCVQDEKTEIPPGVEIVAYEPTFAIGTGNPDTPQNVRKIAAQIMEKGKYTLIYGGSVSKENVEELVKAKVNGVLVGATNSLDPQKFIDIILSLK